MTSKTEYVLWCQHPAYVNGEWFRMSSATSVRTLRTEQNFRIRNGFKTAIYAKGTQP